MLIATTMIPEREYPNGLPPTYLGDNLYDYQFLVEGDSWMDSSGPLQSSLLPHLAFDNKTSLALNTAQSGATMRVIQNTLLSGKWLGWLADGAPLRFEAMLFSAGGNDFINAASDPPPGEGILKLCTGAEVTVQDCIRQDAIDLLVKSVDQCFAQFHNAVRSTKKGEKLPIFLNLYSVPIARDAPAVNGLIGPWLWKGLKRNKVPPALYQPVVERIFADLQTMIAKWPGALGDSRLHVVDTDSVALIPAQAGSTGESGDWLNEIHPNRSGWSKLSIAWEQALANQGIA